MYILHTFYIPVLGRKTGQGGQQDGRKPCLAARHYLANKFSLSLSLSPLPDRRLRPCLGIFENGEWRRRLRRVRCSEWPACEQSIVCIRRVLYSVRGSRSTNRDSMRSARYRTLYGTSIRPIEAKTHHCRNRISP